MNWRRWTYQNWKAATGLWGTAFYTTLYFAYPAELRTRETVAGTLILACTIAMATGSNKPPRAAWVKS
jgi:hypothetical protein